MALPTTVLCQSRSQRPQAADGAEQQTDAEREYWEAVKLGLARFESGHWPEAIAFFKRAHAIKPSARTARGLGQVYFEARRYARAVHFLEQALAAPEGLTPEHRASATELLGRARAFTAELHLVVSPAGASVQLDGQPLDPDQRTVRVNAGEHTVSARLAGHAIQTRHVQVEGGVPMTVEIALVPDATPVAGASDGAAEEPMRVNPQTRDLALADRDATDAPHLLRVLGWTGVGTAAAACATALVLWRMRESGPVAEFIALDCASPNAPVGCAGVREEADALQTGMWIAGIGAGVLAAVGVTALVFDGQRDASEDNTNAASMACALGPLQVACHGRF